MCILLYYTVDNVVLVYSCDLVSHFDFLFTTNRRRIGQQDGHTTNNYTYEYNYTLLFLLCVFFLYRISMKKWQCVCLAIVMLQWIWKHFPFLSGDPVQFKKMVSLNICQWNDEWAPSPLLLLQLLQVSHVYLKANLDHVFPIPHAGERVHCNIKGKTQT